MSTAKQTRIFENTKRLLPTPATVVVGQHIQFAYSGKERIGIVDKIGVSANGEHFTLALYNGTFRCFTLSKCVDIIVVSYS